MRFDLTEVQSAWHGKARALAANFDDGVSPGGVVLAAARSGLLDPGAGLLSEIVATSTIAAASPSAGLAYALHVCVAHALAQHPRREDVWRGDLVGALALTADSVPVETAGKLNGEATWVAPATAGGMAIVGARTADQHEAFAVALDDPGVTMRAVEATGLRGVPCAQLTLAGVAAVRLGSTAPLMAKSRVMVAAVGLGIGRRALDEALAAVRASGGAEAGEQAVQGLLADTATELDAAMLLTWEAASAHGELALGKASIAKLSATEAAQRAVLRATQVVGADTFRRDHTIERLSQDVRALELFAGRTEALRAAVAVEILP